MSFFSRLLLKVLLPYFDLIGVRDTGSIKFLSNNLNINQVMLGSDPAFLLKRRVDHDDRSKIYQKFNIPYSSKIVCIIPSNDKFHDMNYISYMNKFISKITKDNIYIIYAITDMQKGYDLDIYNNNILLTNDKTYWLEPNNCNLESLLEIITACNCVISSRMHPLIFSLIQETPIICISRGS